MKIEKIKPTPKYILALIEKVDKRANHKPCGQVRYYAYLTKNDGELCKVTVAVKVYKGKWYCKQVAVHGLHSDKCFCRDIEYSYIGGYKVGWYAEGITSSPRFWEDGKWYTPDDKYYNPFAHLVNPEYAYKIPDFKYSACELYKGEDIIEYLRIYEKYPQAEYLVKLGLSRYALSKQILTKIATDKTFRKFLGKNRDTLSSDKFYYVSSILSAYKQNKPIETIQDFEHFKKELSNSLYKSVRDLIKGTETEQLYNYLKKQNTNITLYRDYISACRELGLDMTKNQNRYPHEFTHFHDMRIDEMRIARAIKDEQRRKEAEQERKHLAEKFLAVANKYLPLQSLTNEAFIVIIAQTPTELVKEGEALHHCVGKLGYDRKFVREESLIFFVRSATDTETPLATVEYSIEKKKILQCYADHNSKPDQAVMTFVNDIWLPYANRTLTKISA